VSASSGERINALLCRKVNERPVYGVQHAVCRRVLEFLIDITFAMFGGRFLQETVGIPGYQLSSFSRRLVPLFV
jgi:hypothetical protein